MKRYLKIIISIFYYAFLKLRDSLLFFAAKKKEPLAIILYYHSVYKKDIQRFDKQMRYLAENVNVIKSHDIFKSLHNKINVAITFDDGFENVYLNALPLLHRYSLPYTIFFVTDYLGKFPEWEYPDDHPDRKEKIMTKEQLISLNSEFGTIGSHTCSHRKLNGIDRNDLMYELKNSKLFLEQTAGREIDHLSFPNGAYDKIVLEESIKAGYKYIYTIDPENAYSQKERSVFGRFDINPSDPFIEFWLKIHGGYQWQKHFKSLKNSL